MKVSIVIPTLNEEKRIGQVLGQFDEIKKTIDLELIIGDGGSIDKTEEIAKQHGAKFYSNSREDQTIAKNRNVAGKNATGEVIVFCDADTRLDNPAKFISKIIEVFSAKPEIVGAVPVIKVFPEERIWKDKLFHGFYNGSIKASFFVPFVTLASGQCQIIRKSAFDKAGGYPEEIIHGEDAEMFKRLNKIGKIKYLSDLTILESPRRYRHYGYMRYLLISTKSIIGQALTGKNVLKEWKRVDGAENDQGKSK
jgi:glycosyltransferase involved in cell wall biosynthesis